MLYYNKKTDKWNWQKTTSRSSDKIEISPEILGKNYRTVGHWFKKQMAEIDGVRFLFITEKDGHLYVSANHGIAIDLGEDEFYIGYIN